MESKNPVSARKLASARANGARSKGPATADGKARSSQNATRHGLCANTIVLEIEDRDQYHHLRDVYLVRFKPSDEVELDLVEEMVNCKWRQRRNLVVETETINLHIEGQEEDLNDDFEVLSDQTRLAVACNALDLDKLHRYETRLLRQYNRAFKMLMELKRDLPNETGQEPAQAEPAAPPAGIQAQTSPIPETTKQEHLYGFQSQEYKLCEVQAPLGCRRVVPELGVVANTNSYRARTFSGGA